MGHGPTVGGAGRALAHCTGRSSAEEEGHVFFRELKRKGTEVLLCLILQVDGTL